MTAAVSSSRHRKQYDPTLPNCPNGHPWATNAKLDYRGYRSCETCTRKKADKRRDPPSDLYKAAPEILHHRIEDTETIAAHNCPPLSSWQPFRSHNLEDCFEAVNNVLRILEIAYSRTGNDLLLLEPKFGIGVMLNSEEFNRVSQHLSQLELPALQARQHARTIQNLIQNTDLPDADHIDFDVDLFNADLNSILFASATFGEAIAKLASVQHRAEDFVSAVSRTTAQLTVGRRRRDAGSFENSNSTVT